MVPAVFFFLKILQCSELSLFPFPGLFYPICCWSLCVVTVFISDISLCHFFLILSSSFHYCNIEQLRYLLFFLLLVSFLSKPYHMLLPDKSSRSTALTKPKPRSYIGPHCLPAVVNTVGCSGRLFGVGSWLCSLLTVLLHKLHPLCKPPFLLL